MSFKHNKLLIVSLWTAILAVSLSGCVSRQPTGSSSQDASDSSSSQEASDSSSSQPYEPYVYDWENPPLANDMAQIFTRTLEARDWTTLATLCTYANGAESLAYLNQLQLDSISCTGKQPDPYSGTYDLTLDVSDPGPTNLPAGQGTYVLSIGSNYMFGGPPTVLSINTPEKFEAHQQALNDPAGQLVIDMRSWGITQTFTTPAEIDPEQMMDFLILMGSRYYGTKIDEYSYDPLTELTQEQIDAMAQKYFNLDSFVLTTSRYYNKETQLYELWGRGGGYSNEKVIEIQEDASTKNKKVTVEVYSDPLQLVTYETLCYTVIPRADGTYYVASAEKLA